MMLMLESTQTTMIAISRLRFLKSSILTTLFFIGISFLVTEDFKFDGTTGSHRRRLSFAYPETVTLKTSGQQIDSLDNANSATHSSPSSPVDDLSSLRIVAFGTSRTWGAGLRNRRQQAYVWLLNRSATNLGIRATGPDVPALCTYTMINNNIYDVILVEFLPRTQQDNRWLARMTQRLRARFPHAQFIFIRFHLLVGYQHTSGETAFDWLTKRHKHKSLWDIAAIERDLMSTQPSDWAYTPNNPQEPRNLAQDKVIASVNGILLEFPSRQLERVDPRQDILQNALLFGERDWNHPSMKGHQQLASEIHEILNNLAITQNPFHSSTRDLVGPWLGGRDRCDNWFSQQSPVPAWTEGKATLLHDPRMIMRDISGNKDANVKTALEVPEDGGYIEVINDLDSTAELFINHMTAGPAPTMALYPTTEVTMDGFPDIRVSLVPLMQSSHHVQVTAYIGVIPPGKHTLRLQPLEQKAKPFRVTGIIVSPLKGLILPSTTK